MFEEKCKYKAIGRIWSGKIPGVSKLICWDHLNPGDIGRVFLFAQPSSESCEESNNVRREV